jgi:hypothetical protein
MFSPLVPWMAKVHQETLLEEARRGRMVARSRARLARLEVRVLVGLGVFLISMGLRLHQRHLPKMETASESYGPACG